MVDGINPGRQWKSASRISFNEANSNDGVQCVSVVVKGINEVIKKKIFFFEKGGRRLGLKKKGNRKMGKKYRQHTKSSISCCLDSSQNKIERLLFHIL